MDSGSPEYLISELSEPKAGPTEPDSAMTRVGLPGSERPTQPRTACPGCGRVLSIRVLAEKHRCDRMPRKPWKMGPEKLLERRRRAAERRFQCRMARREGV